MNKLSKFTISSLLVICLFDLSTYGLVNSLSQHIASPTVLLLIGLLRLENPLLHFYLTIKTGHETLSETFLDTLPSPLKSLDTPVKPTLPITTRSTFSFVA